VTDYSSRCRRHYLGNLAASVASHTREEAPTQLPSTPTGFGLAVHVLVLLHWVLPLTYDLVTDKHKPIYFAIMFILYGPCKYTIKTTDFMIAIGSSGFPSICSECTKSTEFYLAVQHSTQPTKGIFRAPRRPRPRPPATLQLATPYSHILPVG
jgi:hypothetical protein